MKKFALPVILFIVMMIITACSGSSESDSTTTTVGDTNNNNQEKTEEQEVITLKAVTVLPSNDFFVKPLEKYGSLVEEKTNGKVKINWMGGPESIPGPDQAEATRNGVVDMSFSFSTYYDPIVPEIRSILLSKLSPWEERENGFFNYMVDAHKKIDVQYLGRWMTNDTAFYLYSNDPVSTPSDLNGKSFRTNTVYDLLLRELGVSPVTVSPSETYTALETGMVNGFGWGGLVGPREYGWTDSTKYVIDHRIYNMTGSIIMNSNSWNKLSDEVKAQINEATAEYERYISDYFIEETEKERKILEEEGIQFIKFSPKDEEYYLNTAYEVHWKYLEERVPGEVKKLKEITE